MNRQTYMILALMMAYLMVMMPVVSALRITDVQVTDVTTTEASVSFVTDEVATGAIEYGKSISVPDSLDSPSGNLHKFSLTGLDPDSLYFFQARAVSLATQKSVINRNSNDYFEIRTRGGLDKTPPIISNISYSDFETSSTTVAWLTDDESTSTVWAKTTSGYRSTQDNAYKKNHRITFDTTAGQETTVKLMSCNFDDRCRNSTPRVFTAGVDQQPPGLEAVIPRYTTEPKILITGTTEPQARVTVLVNGRPVREVIAKSDGSFSIPNVPLGRIENTVAVRSRDIAGNAEMVQETVIIDAAPPRLRIFGFEQVNTGGTLNLRGRANEAVELSVFVKLSQDKVQPQRVTGVTVTDIRPGRVGLSWTASEDDDHSEYAIYRNGKLIGTSDSTSFFDEAAPADSSNAYRVSAIDTSCNEGPLSDTILIQTSSAGTPREDQEEVAIACRRPQAVFDAQGDFTKTLQLLQGENEILILAKDRSGNVMQYKNYTIYDSIAPSFEDLNLDKITPTYTREVKIRGKASERVSVLVFLNDNKKPAETAISYPDGSFEIDLDLPIGRLVEEPGKVTAQISAAGYSNQVVVEIIDIAGNKVRSSPAEIVYTTCGFGSDFRVDLTNIRPAILTPALIEQGVAQIGFNLNVTYIGTQGNFSFRGDPSINIRKVSREDEDKWDEDVAIPTPKWDKQIQNERRGYVKITPNRPSFPDTMTRIQRFNSITDKRNGECSTVPQGFGCLRIPLMLEIRGVNTIERSVAGQDISDQLGPMTEEILQRECIEIQVSIDRAIDPDIIHDDFLEGSIEAFDNIIEAIDQVIEPLQTIFQAVLYTCLAGFAVLFIMDIWEVFQCEISVGLAAFEDGDPFNPEIARAGLCNSQEYGYMGDDEAAKLDDCKQCQTATQRNKDMRFYIQWVCDRVYCPSVPTITKYANDAGETKGILAGQKSTRDDIKWAQEEVAKPEEETSPDVKMSAESLLDQELKFGSSCQGVNANNYEGIKQILEDYESHKKDSVDLEEEYDRTEPNCNNLHPSNPACCGFEYDEEYDSACIFMDELEESKCAQAKLQGIDDPDCGVIRNVLNSLSGFCESEGAAGKMVYTHMTITKSPGDTKDNGFWLYIMQGGDATLTESSERKVTGAYNINKKSPGVDVSAENIVSITETNGLKLTEDYSDFFRAKTINCAAFGKKMAADKSKFGLEAEGGDFNNAAEAACKEVVASFPSNRQYIVDPTSSFLRSLQCGCIAGVNSYLQQYRNVLNSVNNCLKSILVTGDGYEGQCDAILSSYICDIIYEIISCTVQLTDFTITREGKAGVLERIGGFAKTLTNAGQKTQQSITNRYGASAIFKSMFSERKLVHAICLFAFTGTWSFDVEALISGEIPTIPIDSTAFIYPAERRFVSFDSSTKPSGTTTHNYHIGMSIAAGADLTHRMFLQCSAGIACKESDGFEDNKCDCFKTGERRTPVSLSKGSLKAGEMFTQELYLNYPGDGNGDIRYDKVIYEYEYRDANDRTQKETIITDISQVGGDAPVFCQFDILASIYRCTLDIGSEYYAQFQGDPYVDYSEESRPYKQLKWGDAITFKVPILQRSDTCNSPLCKDSKALIWKLRSGNTVIKDGNVLMTNDPYINDPKVQGRISAKGQTKSLNPFEEYLNHNGEAVKTIKMGTLKDSMFVGESFGNIKVISKDDTDRNNFGISGIPERDTTLFFYHNYILEYDGIHSIIPSSNLRKRYERSKIDKRYMILEQTSFKVTIPLPGTQVKMFKDNNDDPIIIQISREDSAENFCKEFNDRPEEWVADFEIRNAEPMGPGSNVYKPSAQIAVDASGIQQKVSVKLKVICSNIYVQTAESKTGITDKRCEPGFPNAACHCFSGDDDGLNQRLNQDIKPNCGPSSSPITTPLEGDYCNTAGECINSNKCEENKIMLGQETKCRCYSGESQFISAMDNNEEENCGLGISPDQKRQGNLCIKGECKATPLYVDGILAGDEYNRADSELKNGKWIIEASFDEDIEIVIKTYTGSVESSDLTLKERSNDPGEYKSQKLRFIEDKEDTTLGEEDKFYATKQYTFQINDNQNHIYAGEINLILKAQ